MSAFGREAEMLAKPKFCLAYSFLNCIDRQHAPTVDVDGSVEVQAVNVASFVFSTSIVGFMTSATPGIASTLSNS
jgi:hypothetical protein